MPKRRRASTPSSLLKNLSARKRRVDGSIRRGAVYFLLEMGIYGIFSIRRHKKARTDGYVETLFGRRRPTPDVHSTNFIVRQAAERAAINMPIQGTEADLMKMAMLQVQNKLAGTKTTQLLQIHDSILVECPEADGESIARLLKETMEAVHKLPVKLTVDTTIGKNWGEL